MPTAKFTTEVLTAAILGFESQKQHIDEQIAELRRMLDGNQPEPTVAGPGTGKRNVLSADARARIAAAQRKRWAAVKQGAAKPEPAARKRRKLSAAGRKAISDATKARWARVKAEAGKPKTAAKKVAGRKAAKRTAGKPKAAGVAASQA